MDLGRYVSIKVCAPVRLSKITSRCSKWFMTWEFDSGENNPCCRYSTKGRTSLILCAGRGKNVQ